MQAANPIVVTRSRAERPLRAILIVTAIVLWAALIVSVVGLVYGLLLWAFLFFAHMVLIARLRGSAIKLGPQQMPELHERAAAIAQRIGMAKAPEVYLQESGGVLNAFATRFGRRRFVVLNSDLVEACGDNEDALDFIIGHELGHIHCGHLNWRWLIGPALFIPFLGTAYSRACEYTCDRYGFLAASNPDRAIDGLCILAAGPRFSPRINKRAFVAQRGDMETVFMKLGQWLETHPPVAHRIGALVPSLRSEHRRRIGATIGAAAVALLVFAVPLAGGAWFLKTAIHDIAKKIALKAEDTTRG